MVKKIVLTGGPSSGKTSVLEKIDQIYSAQGYRVILVDETATYLINKGIKPFGEGKIDLVDFQELVMKMQLAKEDVIERADAVCEDLKGQDPNTIYVCLPPEMNYEEVVSVIYNICWNNGQMLNEDNIIHDERLFGVEDIQKRDTEGRSEEAVKKDQKKAVKSFVKDLTKKEAAKVVGQEVAKRALEKGITEVVFDRGGYVYMGRVECVADGAREAGLKF